MQVFSTLLRVQRVPSVTRVKVTFTVGHRVFAGHAAAMDTAACWLHTPTKVPKCRRSYCDLIVTTIPKGLLLLLADVTTGSDVMVVSDS